VTSAAPARRVFAVVPAAGRGARFDPSAKSSPKQYAPLLGATVIEWSLRALLQEPRIEAVVVAVAADDMRWPALAAAIGRASDAIGVRTKTAEGGRRCEPAGVGIERPARAASSSVAARLGAGARRRPALPGRCRRARVDRRLG